MNNEVPEVNPPLSPEEQSVVAGLTSADIETIDSAILANSSSDGSKWRVLLGTR
jgi:hypothetical protein